MLGQGIIINDKIWLCEPSILFKSPYFWPTSYASTEENINRVTRFLFFMSILIALTRKSTYPLYIGLFLIFFIGIIYFLGYNQDMGSTESFLSNSKGFFYPINDPSYIQAIPNPQMYPQAYPQMYPQSSGDFPTYRAPSYKSEGVFNPYNEQVGQSQTHAANIRNYANPPPDQYLNKTEGVVRTVPNLREPTSKNPFMNPPITSFDAPQIYKNYNRYETPTYPTPKTLAVEQEVEGDFTKGLFQDANGRLFDRNNSQRQFYSTPNGSVPNKQDEFANYLYGVKNNCKSGSIYMRYGIKSTNDSKMCTGYNSGTDSLTNFGQLKLD